MKIELDVDPKDLAKSMKEILDTLPPEKRAEIAKSTMEAWLREPYDLERKAHEEEILRNLRPQRDYSGRQEADDEIRRGYKFQDAMRGWKSTKEQMVATVTQEIVANYKAQVKGVVESDPKIQAMKDEVVKIVKETFPTIVHQAMIAFMASNMTAMLDAAMGVQQIAKRADDLQEAVAQRLNEVESRVASRM